MRITEKSIPLLALLALLAPHALRAQAVSGTILGSVEDSSGAAVPGASVTIANSETGLRRTVTTDSGGDYNAPSLPPGAYSVSTEMTGFKKVSYFGVRYQEAPDLFCLELFQFTDVDRLAHLASPAVLRDEK